MELQSNKTSFEAEGIKLFAISYDSVEALGAFAKRHRIDYPMLSDSDSKVIRKFGILNTLVLPDETEYYGIPFPGSYVIGNDGKVISKFFNRQYQVRETASTMMYAGFGVLSHSSDLSLGEVSGGDGVQIRAGLLDMTLRPHQRSFIFLTLELAEGIHVYGEPASDGFLPITVQATGTQGLNFDEPQFPETKPFTIAEIDEEFNAYEGKVEIVIPVVSTIREAGIAEIEIKVSFQACTDAMCYIPRAERIKLELEIAPNVPKIE